MARKRPGFASHIREALASMKKKPARGRAWGYKPSGEQKKPTLPMFVQDMGRRTKGGFASKLVKQARKPRGK